MESKSKIRESLALLAAALEEKQVSLKNKIADRELTGNKIHGGLITNFQSQGIRDTADRTIIEVSNNGLRVRYADIDEFTTPIKVNGNVTVYGDMIADKLKIYDEISAKKLSVEYLKVDELIADTRIDRSTSLTFQADAKKLSGKGLLWAGDGNTKQFIYKAPDNIWSSENIDLNHDKSYKINNIPVLSKDTLGSSVVNSSLRSLGRVNNLTTSGNIDLDNFIFYKSSSQKIGIGTENPNGIISIVYDTGEFIFDKEFNAFNIGTYTTDNFNLCTDNTTRISISSIGHITLHKKVSVEGKLGINVKNIDNEVDLATAGAVSFQNKKFTVDNVPPSAGRWNRGDIVWNDKPIAGGFVGWICVGEGTPGLWKTFGQIQN